MEMKPDEIVVRYRQAKEKGKQLNILAELNACSVDDIVKVLVEHGGYKLDRLSRSRGKAKLLKKEESNKIVENLTGKLKPESVKHPEPEKIPAAIKRAIEAGYRELIDEINARKERIEELEMEIAEFEKEIDVIKDWEVEHT